MTDTCGVFYSSRSSESTKDYVVICRSINETAVFSQEYLASTKGKDDRHKRRVTATRKRCAASESRWPQTPAILGATRRTFRCRQSKGKRGRYHILSVSADIVRTRMWSVCGAAWRLRLELARLALRQPCSLVFLQVASRRRRRLSISEHGVVHLV